MNFKEFTRRCRAQRLEQTPELGEAFAAGAERAILPGPSALDTPYQSPAAPPAEKRRFPVRLAAAVAAAAVLTAGGVFGALYLGGLGGLDGPLSSSPAGASDSSDSSGVSGPSDGRTAEAVLPPPSDDTSWYAPGTLEAGDAQENRLISTQYYREGDTPYLVDDSLIMSIDLWLQYRHPEFTVREDQAVNDIARQAGGRYAYFLLHPTGESSAGWDATVYVCDFVADTVTGVPLFEGGQEFVKWSLTRAAPDESGLLVEIYCGENQHGLYYVDAAAGASVCLAVFTASLYVDLKDGGVSPSNRHLWYTRTPVGDYEDSAVQCVLIDREGGEVRQINAAGVVRFSGDDRYAVVTMEDGTYRKCDLMTGELSPVTGDEGWPEHEYYRIVSDYRAAGAVSRIDLRTGGEDVLFVVKTAYKLDPEGRYLYAYRMGGGDLLCVDVATLRNFALPLRAELTDAVRQSGVLPVLYLNGALTRMTLYGHPAANGNYDYIRMQFDQLGGDGSAALLADAMRTAFDAIRYYGGDGYAYMLLEPADEPETTVVLFEDYRSGRFWLFQTYRDGTGERVMSAISIGLSPSADKEAFVRLASGAVKEPGTDYITLLDRQETENERERIDPLDYAFDKEQMLYWTVFYEVGDYYIDGSTDNVRLAKSRDTVRLEPALELICSLDWTKNAYAPAEDAADRAEQSFLLRFNGINKMVFWKTNGKYYITTAFEMTVLSGEQYEILADWASGFLD